LHFYHLNRKIVQDIVNLSIGCFWLEVCVEQYVCSHFSYNVSGATSKPQVIDRAILNFDTLSMLPEYDRPELSLALKFLQESAGEARVE